MSVTMITIMLESTSQVSTKQSSPDTNSLATIASTRNRTNKEIASNVHDLAFETVPQLISPHHHVDRKIQIYWYNLLLKPNK